MHYCIYLVFVSTQRRKFCLFSSNRWNPVIRSHKPHPFFSPKHIFLNNPGVHFTCTSHCAAYDSCQSFSLCVTYENSFRCYQGRKTRWCVKPYLMGVNFDFHSVFSMRNWSPPKSFFHSKRFFLTATVMMSHGVTEHTLRFWLLSSDNKLKYGMVSLVDPGIFGHEKQVLIEILFVFLFKNNVYGWCMIVVAKLPIIHKSTLYIVFRTQCLTCFWTVLFPVLLQEGANFPKNEAELFQAFPFLNV